MSELMIYSLVRAIFILLVTFQIKHLISDYFLQNSFMLQKFKPNWGFVLPLTAHAGVHALFTLVICLVVNPTVFWLAGVDFIIHFIMDRIKAGPKYLGRFKALSGNEYMEAVKNNDMKKLRHNKYFWWSLGFDQCIHHLTHYAIILGILFF